MEPKVLVITGNGLNCEAETVHVYNMVGAVAHKVHINDLLARPKTLENYQILDAIGGFVDGDHLGAGKVHANRFKFGLEEELY